MKSLNADAKTKTKLLNGHYIVLLILSMFRVDQETYFTEEADEDDTRWNASWTSWIESLAPFFSPKSSWCTQLCYEFITKRTIDFHTVKLNKLKAFFPLKASSGGSCSAGGNALDIAVYAYPLMMHRFFHSIQTYSVEQIVSVGGAAMAEPSHIIPVLSVHGKVLDLKVVSFEILYCAETKDNIRKMLNHYPTASLGTIHSIILKFI
jgi:hypothetical protein